MAKGTQFSRTMQYFHEVTLDEAKAALHAAEEVVEGRMMLLDIGKEALARGSRKRAGRKSRVADDLTLTPQEHTALTAATKALREAASA